MSSIGPGRGHFETMEVQGGTWQISGWVCHPDVPTSAIALRVDGIEVEEVEPSLRQDVATVIPWIQHASASGFRFSLARQAGARRVVVEARNDRRLLTSLCTTLRPEFEALARPPAELMRRVSASPDPRFFDADGVRSYTEFVDAVAQYRDWGSIARMLDWGCGCGRVTRCFLRAHPGLEVHGCDIDSEAVAWCSENLADGHFRAIQPQPTTGYPDGHFPLVIGYSVFSHLDQGLQRDWLEEMRRVIAPGGLFLASVHGPFAARFALAQTSSAKAWWRPRRRRSFDVRAAGFLDAGEDLALAGVAPVGYYRGTFQSPEWTRREWSRYFRVLEVREGGMQNYQDLVILERN